MKKVQDLITVGLARIANLPPSNPSVIAGKYVIPLIAHDYPAKTAIMWNKAYRHLGWPIVNVMLTASPKDIETIFDTFRQDANYLGGGAGVGFKVESIPFLDEMDSNARMMGAVNFILKTADGKLKGYNTDGLGYAQSLHDLFLTRDDNLVKKKIVILGAGGAGNAIAFALAHQGGQLVIINRTVAKARQLAEKINESLQLSNGYQARFGGEDVIGKEICDADAIVNVSTKGVAGEMASYSALAPAELPVNLKNIRSNLEQAKKLFDLIPSQTIISDIVLSDQSTPFLAEAKKRGYTTLGGEPMVINQAVEAFYLLHERDLKKKQVTKAAIKKIMKKAAGL